MRGLTVKNSYMNGQAKSDSKKISCRKHCSHRMVYWIKSNGTEAEKFTDNVYDYFIKLADKKRSFAFCRDPERASLGYKCVFHISRNILLSLWKRWRTCNLRIYFFENDLWEWMHFILKSTQDALHKQRLILLRMVAILLSNCYDGILL